MATNMAPHNLVEVVDRRHGTCSTHPEATLEELMQFVPGPGPSPAGHIVGLDGIRDAYEHRARILQDARHAHRSRTSASRRKGIVVTELPYQVGPERLTEKLRTRVQTKKVSGISDDQDLTDRKHGLRLVSASRPASTPRPCSSSCTGTRRSRSPSASTTSRSSTGQPRTLGLTRDARGLRRPPARRSSRRRTELRLAQAHGAPAPRARACCVAILDIDEVIQIIRSTERAPRPRGRLMTVFDLDRCAGRVHPRAAPAPPHEVLPDRSRDRARRSAAESAARGDPRVRCAHLTTGRRRARGVSDYLGTPRRTVLMNAKRAPERPAKGAKTSSSRMSRHCRSDATGRALRIDMPDGDVLPRQARSSTMRSWPTRARARAVTRHRHLVGES